MEIIPDKRPIVGLVEQAHVGKICLPNFQRDFVWTREEVADLVRSIARGYFIGSLLLLRCDPANPPFAPVAVRGAEPTHTPLRPEHLILDGQQRLSSLLYALTAPDRSLKDSSKRRWFFLDLALLADDPDDDEIVFSRTKRDLRDLDKREVQFEQRILPCTALLDTHSFYSWRDGFEDWLRERHPDQLEAYRAAGGARQTWTDAVGQFQRFEVPLVELPRVDEGQPDAIGRVCAIFEKLNSTGVDLSVYDLLTARLYRSGIRLHDLWDQACHDHQHLLAWSGGKADQHKFGVLALRTLALLRGLDPKPRILIDLEPDQFEADWRRAAAAMDRAIELVTHVGQDGFGVFDKKWLPGFGLLPVLAALRAELESHGLGADARRDLRQWYWCNVFTERYSSAVETKSRRDYAEMTAYWFKGGPEPSSLSGARQTISAPTFRIRSSASYASAVYSGVFCLLAIRGARDWQVDEHIELQKLQDHHIFPQAYLKRHGLTKKPEINTIVNRTLISDKTNQKIKDKAPAVYVDSAQVFADGDPSQLLELHYCPPSVADLLRAAAETPTNESVPELYARFLDAREQQILEEIRAVCGAHAAQPGDRDAITSVIDDEVAADFAAEDAVDDEPDALAA
ncbi:hypothetical protein C8N24_0686 [Solirubrobacter pauli]|uniref:GmrSD restriction endonucleases N-terminal domain-containing protein n=1 Tax=Solirubrobacter pauli TaxID=166793 RepID=A0A660LDQ8_9ACTN|nr:DUF262 domain-containing protein [Solirubrobacter pauli]RKQ90871.1 hypothetical protein C8N24_0686 [Solirubrobacter pauli]